MKKSKCIYCGSKVGASTFSVRSILTKNELRKFNDTKPKKVICEECQTQMFMLNLS